MRLSWVTWRAFGTLGVLGIVASLVEAFRRDSLGFDLNRIALRASDAFVHGHPLYLSAAQLHHPLAGRFTYVYPPLYAEILSPLLLIPPSVLAAIAAVASLAAAVGALWIVGVRDPRVFTVTVCSYPVVFGCEVANASLLLLPLLALAWKHRGPLPLAVALAIKPLLWCCVLWLWISRGRSAAARTVFATGALLALSWALIAFEGLLRYPQILRLNDRTNADYSYGISTGLPHGGALAIALTLAALLAAWRRSRAGDEVGVFSYCVFASLLAAPIVWMHSFSALLLPLALRRPTFTPVWLVVLAGWAAVHDSSTALPEVTRVAVWLVVGALALWLGEGATVPEHTFREAYP